MSTRPEIACQRHPAHPGQYKLADPPSELRGSDSSRLPSAESVLDECVGAISLVEVTVHSLDSQGIAVPEQEVLKRALLALRSVHDWIYDRSWPDTAAQSAGERECRP